MNSFIANVSAFATDLICNQAIQWGTVGGANGQPEYIGYAPPGSAVTDEVWLIKKLTYDASGHMTLQQFANGVHAFNLAFVNPQLYNYS